MMLWVSLPAPWTKSGRVVRIFQGWEHALEWADYFDFVVKRVRFDHEDSTIQIILN